MQHRISIAALIAFALAGTGTTAEAQMLPSWHISSIAEVWADPSDITLRTRDNGPCGGPDVTIPRSLANFQELTALMYTGATAGNTIKLNVVSCNGQRNIISHGSVLF